MKRMLTAASIRMLKPAAKRLEIKDQVVFGHSATAEWIEKFFDALPASWWRRASKTLVGSGGHVEPCLSGCRPQQPMTYYP
jgi:hypothetical protein